MRRRDVLVSGAAAAAGLTLGPRLRAQTRTERDPVAAAFAKRLAQDPRLLGYATASAERFDAEAALVAGKPPRDLVGTLYRNGPARHEVGGRRYHHCFDGDGLVQAFRFAEGGLRHRARFVETAKLARERKAGRPLVQGFGTTWPDLPPPTDPAKGNPANISVLWHADRLLALWEASDAYALDPVSLATQGLHTWSPETEGVPFSAHPRVDPDGTLWNFGSAWEEKGTLHADACVYPDASVMYEQQRKVMWGEWAPATFPTATSWSLDLDSGRIRSEARGLASEFPSIDPRRTGQRHRHVVALARIGDDSGGLPLLDAVTRQDIESGTVQHFQFPTHVIPEEHLLVPRPNGAEGEAWVIGTALDTKERATELNVFDALRLEDGPVATWRLPYALPLGLHGRFVA